MAEEVLCGAIRLDDPGSYRKKSFEKKYRKLKSLVSFVYLSVPSDRNPPGDLDFPSIKDHSGCCHDNLIGPYSVLKVLRQPILFVSHPGPQHRTTVLSKLIDRWTSSLERISGVFPITKQGFNFFPGIYASPLLQTLRGSESGNPTSILRSEPIKTVNLRNFS